MPITLNCPKCHKPFRVRDESIGGRVRCPSCGSVLQVPASLAPASHFGDGPKTESPEEASRPVAEDFHGRSMAGVSLHEVVLPPDREGKVDLSPPAGAPLPGPPSIKARVPLPAPGIQLPSPPARPTAPSPVPSAPSPDRPRQPIAPPRPLSDDEVTWARVMGGLGMIRLGALLLVLLVLAIFAQGVWIVLDYEHAWSNEPGLLKRADWPLKKELFVAYTAGLTIPAAFLLLVGRARCGSAPSESHARGMAQAATFFTVIAIIAAGIVLGVTYFDLAAKAKLLERETRLTALYVAVASVILADILTMLFAAQIGWALRRPQILKSVAGYFVYAVVLAAGVAVGELLYPVLEPLQDSMRKTGGGPFEGPEDELTRRVVIWSVAGLTAVILLLLRYATIARRGRAAIKNLLAGQT